MDPNSWLRWEMTGFYVKFCYVLHRFPFIVKTWFEIGNESTKSSEEKRKLKKGTLKINMFIEIVDISPFLVNLSRYFMKLEVLLLNRYLSWTVH